MEIRTIPLADIVPYAGNPRHIPHAAVQQVAESIRQYGWQQPLVLDAESVIIAGHTRYAAAHLLGLETAPCYIADHLSPEQAQAYRLADNRTGEIATWDIDILTTEIDALSQQLIDGIDLTVPGFSADELAALLELSSTEPPAPPAPAPARAQAPDAPTTGADPDAATGRVLAPPPPRDWRLECSLIARAAGVV